MFQSLRSRLSAFIGRVEEKADKKADLSAATKVRGLLKQTIQLSEEDLENISWDLQLDLIQSDVAVEAAEEIIAELRSALEGREIDKRRVHEEVKETLKGILLKILSPEGGFDFIDFVRSTEKPVKIVFFGVNGSGKTTTIMRVANLLKRNNFSVVFAAADTFRAGAIEQLTRHGEALGVKTIAHSKGADAAAVIYDAVEHAKAKRIDVVLADTAGRMQTKVNLMDEMKKICRVNKPHLRVFVGDALTGNDALEQASVFNSEVGIDAVILTKMDADVKGGSAISIAYVTKKPIIFVGVGQGPDDLRAFDAGWFVDSILE